MRLTHKCKSYVCYVSPITCEKMEDIYILYVFSSDKIIEFNKTASLIWKEIERAQIEDQDISDEDITLHILKEFKMCENDFEAVKEDVRQIIETLINEDVIKVEEYDV